MYNYTGVQCPALIQINFTFPSKYTLGLSIPKVLDCNKDAVHHLIWNPKATSIAMLEITVLWSSTVEPIIWAMFQRGLVAHYQDKAYTQVVHSY